VDYFASWEVMNSIKNHVLEQAEWFHTKYVILGSFIYFPGQRPQHYSGDFHTHVHVSVTGGVFDSAC